MERHFLSCPPKIDWLIQEKLALTFNSQLSVTGLVDKKPVNNSSEYEQQVTHGSKIEFTDKVHASDIAKGYFTQ